MAGLRVTVVNALTPVILAPSSEGKVEVEYFTVVGDGEEPADLSADVTESSEIALELLAKGAGATELGVKSMVDANNPGISDDATLAEATQTAEELEAATLDKAGANVQLKLYNGVVLNVAPTRPKLGLGVFE